MSMPVRPILPARRIDANVCSLSTHPIRDTSQPRCLINLREQSGSRRPQRESKTKRVAPILFRGLALARRVAMRRDSPKKTVASVSLTTVGGTWITKIVMRGNQ